MEKQERLRLRTANAVKAAINILQNEIPQTGHFNTNIIEFEIPYTDNLGQILIKHNSTAPPESRMLQVGVYRRDTDRLYSIIEPCGDSNEEIINYLKSEDRIEKFCCQIEELSDSVDEYWGDA